MKFKDNKWVKGILAGIGAIVAGGAIMLGGVMIGYPAISALVGLAVAQSATTWNNVVDAAKGDSLGSGILGMSPYLWNGVSFDRTKGTAGSMNVAVIGAVTPADAFANPTTASTIWSLNGIFNGTTWDRWTGRVSNTQGPNLFNSQTTSAANTAITITLTAVAAQRAHIYSVEARCNTAAATSDLLISDGGVTIWTTPPLGVVNAATNFQKTWSTGLTGATNSQMLITLATCGAANTGTLIVQADKF